ncbi:dihydroorotate dehydrogenase B (NAD(+)), electron transfer subunit [Clostridia bacterium]|nr:dihydroorotate dehydrogenase B (NAD(+)), electron transfer subunit [Clostridia bacterium]
MGIEFRVISNKSIAPNVYALKLEGDAAAITAPGQFVNIKLPALFLRRPFSVAEYGADTMTIIYRVVGEGTKRMSRMAVGATLDILIGLGNGFEMGVSRAPLIIGGGLGVPPLLALAKQFQENGVKPTALFGFASRKDAILLEAFQLLCERVIVTYDAEGQRVTDRLDEAVIGRDYIYSCGPVPMMRAIYRSTRLDAQFSLETRMGCGVGICRGCTCETKAGASRICAEGPIFRREQLLW